MADDKTLRLTDPTGWFAAPVRRATPSYQQPPEGPIWLFEAGLPDPATFPADDLARISASVLRDEHASALQYGGAHAGEIACGYAGLRDLLAERTVVHGARNVDRDAIMLTAGAAQGLVLLFEAFVDPGDAVAIESPTWNAILAALDRRGADVQALPMDDDGLQVDALEATLARLAAAGRRLKLLYTIATFNTPTGLCLSLDRRRRVLELADEWDFVIIEDNVYEHLRYEGAHLPSLLELDTEGRVIRVDSFSKILAPGLRLGWITAPPAIIHALASIRGDLGVSQLTARVVARYIKEGLLDTHVAAMVDLYRAKRDAAQAALHRHCEPWVRWRQPEGGFFLWVGLDDAVDAERAMRLALERGVLCRPGERFFGDDGQGRQHFRLAFPGPTIAEIDRGIAVLGDAIRTSLRDRPFS